MKHVFAAATLFVAVLLGFTTAPARESADLQLRAFLQTHLKRYPPGLDQGVRYSAATVHLHGKAAQVFVYVSGQSWCGTGGCTALLVEPRGSSFRILTEFTLVRLPVMVLPTMSHGWHDMAFSVSGGGIVPGYTAILRYNGHSYPSNPSIAPKLPVRLLKTGVVVPLSAQGRALY